MKYTLPVYKQEIADGIAEQVKASASVAYTCGIEVYQPNDKQLEAAFSMIRKSNLACASEHDSDLFFHKSVLVSTNWNANDDCFLPLETWLARATPSHKPTNLGHDEHVIVGHMIDTWAIDEKGLVIAEDTPVDDLPSLFHLVNSAVIYKQWNDDKLIARTADLLEKINAGEMFVSMECIFRGFDYMLRSQADNSFHVVARNADSSFLSKHLRAYGGTGVYQDYQVGRAMRRITFSAKGYVANPANKGTDKEPLSVIFTGNATMNIGKASEINPLVKNNGVLTNNSESCTAKSKENEIMSAEINKALEDQVAELKASAKSLADANKALEDRLAKAAVEQHENLVKDLNAKIEAGAKEVETLKASVTTLTTEKTELTKALDAEKTAKATVETELNTVKIATVKAQRIATLVEGGVSKDSAVATVEKFTSLDDAQFTAIAEMAIQAAKAAFPPKKDEKKKDEKKADASTETLDDAEAETEPTLAAASESGDLDEAKVGKARAALATWLENKFGQKTE